MNEDLLPEENLSSSEIEALQTNTIILSNIIELATSVIINLSGKDIADTINNKSVNRSILSNIVANEIKKDILRI